MLSFITENTVFYIAIPAELATGGPELLHQLALKLIERGKTVKIIYFPAVRNPVHENYQEYNIPFVTEVDDSQRNVLIVPETQISLLNNYSYLKKIIWWLSVDNYFISMMGMKGIINRLLLRKFGCQKYLFFNKRSLQVDMHLVQSMYAKKMLESRQVRPICFLSDYLHESFLSVISRRVDKEDIVVYNPKKGEVFTDKLISYMSGVRFVPIENMSYTQVVDLLRKSKVYIDFGYHPGKDRLPREAAYLHNCIITNTRGSAKYFQDVSIPSEFKFNEDRESFYKIQNKILDCFENYESKLNLFESYRLEVYGQESKFDSELSALIGDN